ncbi:MAG TPA: cation transporter, partial [Deinococcales bacterium]|nr:cation transporter [Deinococcales bacterium]
MSTQLKVTGMTCGHCEQAVKQALEEVAGVTAVSVDRSSSSASVEGSANPAALIAAVR